MVRILLTIWAIAFLGGLFTGQSVFAQTKEPEWAAKPIQCGAPLEVFAQIKSDGMETFFGGLGKTDSVNHEQPMDVFVFLSINLKTQQWVAIEVNNAKTDACIIGYGQGVVFDPAELKEFTSPEYLQ